MFFEDKTHQGGRTLRVLPSLTRIQATCLVHKYGGKEDLLCSLYLDYYMY